MGKDDKTPKTMLDKLVAVIKSQNSPGGSTRQALVKGLKEKFEEVNPAQLKAALKKGTDGGVLQQGQGQRWWVAGHEPPPPVPEETVDIVDLEVSTLL
jgi:hypothetical protein